ncbi:RICIN domain-containing protein [Flavobacteriaceae bacterium]|nr:RICIN domain-containing protein [Flavobacteriaceae bacterium]
MKKNKKQSKMVRTFSITIKSIGILMLFIVIMSCKKDEESEPEVVIELNAPIIQTPTPLIHLEDNLNEQDQLGWCIDTRGNGFNEVLHTHSCKPSGGDVQFTYNEETLQICSVEFTGFCVEMSEGVLKGASLSLVESDTESPNQKFVYNAENGEFNPEENTNLCLAAGSVSSAAGIYMSRSLTLELSSEIDESLKKWIIVSAESTD